MSLPGDSLTAHSQCMVKIDADADIAGTGVFWSFITTAWITVLMAVAKAIFGYIDSKQKASTSINPPAHGAIVRSTFCAIAKEVCNNFVLSLCDLQAFTGTAMLVTGVTLRHSISLYHQEFVILYWWLTINSFWAADFQHDKRNDEHEIESNWWFDKAPSFFRKFVVLVSVILGIFHQSWIIRVEGGRWNRSDKSRCFLYIERWYEPGETWFWISGLSVYAFALACTMFKQSSGWVERFENIIKTKRNHLHTLLLRQEGQLWDQIGRYPRPNTIQVIVTGMEAMVLRLVNIMFWLFVQMLSIWAWSDGDRRVHITMFVFFAIRNTWDLKSHRDLNTALINGQEHSFGFGQWLPLLMILGLMYNLLLSVELPKQLSKHRSL